jgi:hypothetical protein
LPLGRRVRERCAVEWLEDDPVAKAAIDAAEGRIGKPNGRGSLAPSEDTLALAFTARHGDDVRYVALWNRSMRWNGTHWQFENTLAAFDLARGRPRGFSRAR